MSKSNEERVAELNARAPDFIHMLGGRITEVDQQAGTCSFAFRISHEFCHSGDIVQGGFITAMLDATMTHAAFAARQDIVNVASLEVKASFLEVSRAGAFQCQGRVIKTGRSIGFMEAQLFDENGLLTATATTTAKLVLPRQA